MIHSDDEQQALTLKAAMAFQRAAAKVLQRAKQTGTPIIVWRDGRVVAIPPDQFELPSAPEPSEHD